MSGYSFLRKAFFYKWAGAKKCRKSTSSHIEAYALSGRRFAEKLIAAQEHGTAAVPP
jgi:hypothetical protein